MAESSSATSEQGYLAQQNSDLLTERDQLKQELREMKSSLEKVLELLSVNNVYICHYCYIYIYVECLFPFKYSYIFNIFLFILLTSL